MKRSEVIRLAAWSLLAGAFVNALIAQVIGCRVGNVFMAPWTQRYLPMAGRCVCVLDSRGAGWRALSWDVQDTNAAAVIQYMSDHDGTSYTSEVARRLSLRPDPPESVPAWAHFWDTSNWIPDVTSPGGTQRRELRGPFGGRSHRFLREFKLSQPSHFVFWMRTCQASKAP